ncbi:MAG: DUF1565 domain-containing protein [Actinobacteria bacterium]|nr:DUF1565 domain-containing protein [Actinomycetota bacterium]
MHANKVLNNVVTGSALDGIAVFSRSSTDNEIRNNTVEGNGFHGARHRKGDGIRVFGGTAGADRTHHGQRGVRECRQRDPCRFQVQQDPGQPDGRQRGAARPALLPPVGPARLQPRLRRQPVAREHLRQGVPRLHQGLRTAGGGGARVYRARAPPPSCIDH